MTRSLTSGVLNLVAGLFDVSADSARGVAASAESGPKGSDEEKGKEFEFHVVRVACTLTSGKRRECDWATTTIHAGMNPMS